MLMQGIIIVFSISLLQKIGKLVQRQSRQSTLQLLSLPSVEMIKSTSQIKSSIIENISALNACLRSDFFLLSMLTTVQITKKKPEPIIVLRINGGDLNAHAYYTSACPKESQVSRRAGCVSTESVSSSSISFDSTPLGFQEYCLRSSALLCFPHYLSSTIFRIREAPIFQQRLSSLKNMQTPWLTEKRVMAKITQMRYDCLLMFSSFITLLAMMSCAFLQRNMLIIICTKNRQDEARSSQLAIVIN